MDPNRDNPFIRFATFWWGLGVFLIFAVVLTVIVLFNRDKAETLEEVAAKKRYETKAVVSQAQAEALSKEAIEAAIPEVAKQLAASKPVVVAVASTPVAAEPIDPAVMALGKTQYITCMACHGQNGEGGPIAPPLAESDWVSGPAENLIRIQLRGLQGPITVSGKEYNFPVGMTALSYQTDEQIAAVLTFVRNSFGNQASAVKPEQVKALRSEVGKPMLTVKDLIQP